MAGSQGLHAVVGPRRAITPAERVVPTGDRTHQTGFVAVVKELLSASSRRLRLMLTATRETIR